MSFTIFRIKTAVKKLAKFVHRRTISRFRNKPKLILIPSPLLNDPHHTPTRFVSSSGWPAATVLTCLELPPHSCESLNKMNTQAVFQAQGQRPDQDLIAKPVVPVVRCQPLLSTRTIQHPDGLPNTCSNPEEEKLYAEVEQILERPGTEYCAEQQRPARSPVLTNAPPGLVLPVVRPLRWRKAGTAQHPSDLRHPCSSVSDPEEDKRYGEVEQRLGQPDTPNCASQQRPGRGPGPTKTRTGSVRLVTRPLRSQAKTVRYPDGLPYPCSTENDTEEEKLYAEIKRMLEQVGTKGCKNQQRSDRGPVLSPAKSQARPVARSRRPALSARTFQPPDGLPYPYSSGNDPEEAKLYATIEHLLKPSATGGCNDDDQKHDNAITSQRLSSAS